MFVIFNRAKAVEKAVNIKGKYQRIIKIIMIIKNGRKKKGFLDYCSD